MRVTGDLFEGLGVATQAPLTPTLVEGGLDFVKVGPWLLALLLGLAMVAYSGQCR